MKTIILLFFLPFLSYAQAFHRDSIEVKNIGVWNPKDYPHQAGLHSIWIDCANPLIFVNNNIDFKQIEYTIKGGTFEQGDQLNQINLIPFEKNISVQLKYKGIITRTFEFKARDLFTPSFLILKQNGDTITDHIKFEEIYKIRIVIASDDRLAKDLTNLPTYALKKTAYTLVSKAPRNTNKKTIFIPASNLGYIQKEAKKNDELIVETTISTSRYSYILNKQVKEEHKVARSYIIK